MPVALLAALLAPALLVTSSSIAPACPLGWAPPACQHAPSPPRPLLARATTAQMSVPLGRRYAVFINTGPLRLKVVLSCAEKGENEAGSGVQVSTIGHAERPLSLAAAPPGDLLSARAPKQVLPIASSALAGVLLYTATAPAASALFR